MKSYAQYCSLARGLDLVGDRWTLLIVRELLSLGPSRYSDLRRGLPGIATNLLADRLRDLEAAGLIERSELTRPAGTVVFSLTERGAGLRPVVRELVKWGAPLMRSTDDDEFRAHWLLLPLQGLCRDHRPEAPAQVVRVGTVDDGCDVTADAGDIRVTPADSAVHPDAVVNGPPEALVALFAGQLDLGSVPALALVTGDLGAVQRVVGGLPQMLAERDEAPSSSSGNMVARAADVAWP